jgi:hypothetical protein
MTKYFLLTLIIAAMISGLSCKKNPVGYNPELNHMPEPDSTSHLINWQIDTIGTWQSSLTGVWGTDSDNVYAAGFVYNPNNLVSGTNIMHWNGEHWNPEQFWEGDIIAIFGFSKNDIWVGGAWIVDPYRYVLFGHWDGTSWKATKLSYEGGIYSFWGASSNSLFAVGSNGMILHFDGNQWTKMNSGTNISAVSDIFGFSDNQVYASGYDETTGRGVLLYYDGANWQTLFDNIFNGGDPTGAPRGEAASVWGYDTAHVYIWNNAGTFLGNRFGWTAVNTPTDHIFVHMIRGSSYKNVFMAGDYSLLTHWNGKSWHLYQEFSPGSNSDILNGVWTEGNIVFVVGRSPTAKGIVYRGLIGK